MYPYDKTILYYPKLFTYTLLFIVIINPADEHASTISSINNHYQIDIHFYSIFFSSLFLSPRLILSSDHTILKSLQYSKPEYSSSFGLNKSSVTSGYTVDSYISILPL